jgi:hypothetical protein
MGENKNRKALSLAPLSFHSLALLMAFLLKSHKISSDEHKNIFHFLLPHKGSARSSKARRPCMKMMMMLLEHSNETVILLRRNYVRSSWREGLAREFVDNNARNVASSWVASIEIHRKRRKKSITVGGKYVFPPNGNFLRRN